MATITQLTNDEILNLLKKVAGGLDADESLLTNKLIAEYKIALTDTQDLLDKMYKKYGDKVKFSDMASYNRLDNLENQIKKVVAKLQRKQVAISKSGFKTIFKNGSYGTAFALESSLDLKLGFGLLNENVISRAIENPLDRIGWPNRGKQNLIKLTADLNSEITQGLIQGKGYAKTAKLFADKFNVGINKAIRIVQTESHRIRSQAFNDTLEDAKPYLDEAGAGFGKVWIHHLTAGSSKYTPRSSHVAMDGVAANEDGDFTLPSGIKTAGPGLSGVPGEDINCTCGLRTQIEDYEPKFRRDNTAKKITPYQTASEWYKARIKK